MVGLEEKSKICRDFMENRCNRGSLCKFLHDREVCYHYWKMGNCKFGDDCRKKHISVLNRGEKQHRHVKNTENFNPSHDAPTMRVLVEYGKSNCELDISTRDVILVPDLFVDRPNLYDELLDEMYNTGIDDEKLWKLWHGDTHYIADDKLGWVDKCPSFRYVVDKLRDYFGMDVKATRFNWYRDMSEWKPFHFDAAGVKPEKAKTQNFTVGVSIGATRDIAFEEVCSKKVVSFPLPSGMTYCFTRDLNTLWRHGVPQLAPEKQENKGRISIIAWGWLEQREL